MYRKWSSGMEWEGEKGPPYKFGMGPPEGLIRPCMVLPLIALIAFWHDIYNSSLEINN